MGGSRVSSWRSWARVLAFAPTGRYMRGGRQKQCAQRRGPLQKNTATHQDKTAGRKNEQQRRRLSPSRWWPRGRPQVGLRLLGLCASWQAGKLPRALLTNRLRAPGMLPNQHAKPAIRPSPVVTHTHTGRRRGRKGCRGQMVSATRRNKSERSLPARERQRCPRRLQDEHNAALPAPPHTCAQAPKHPLTASRWRPPTAAPCGWEKLGRFAPSDAHCPTLSTATLRPAMDRSPAGPTTTHTTSRLCTATKPPPHTPLRPQTLIPHPP